MKDISITFHKKRWQVVFKRLYKCRGKCDPPNVPKKKIYIDPARNKDELTLLDTVLHEALHACNWHIDEQCITEYATKTATLLYKLGFRLKDNQDD